MSFESIFGMSGLEFLAVQVCVFIVAFVVSLAIAGR